MDEQRATVPPVCYISAATKIMVNLDQFWTSYSIYRVSVSILYFLCTAVTYCIHVNEDHQTTCFSGTLQSLYNKQTWMLKEFSSEITFKLTFSDINYFHCKKIIELLKKDEESGKKNVFGQYSSQRMKVRLLLHFEFIPDYQYWFVMHVFTTLYLNVYSFSFA